MPPNSKFNFPPSCLLLMQEGHLVRSSLTTGLTALRSAHRGERGLYYTGFFQLSIGVERLLKAILIVDHMSKNNLDTPTRETLKKFGHKITELLTAVEG